MRSPMGPVHLSPCFRKNVRGCSFANDATHAARQRGIDGDDSRVREIAGSVGASLKRSRNSEYRIPALRSTAMSSSGARIATSGTTTSRSPFVNITSEPLRAVSANPATESASTHSTPETATSGTTVDLNSKGDTSNAFVQVFDCSSGGRNAPRPFATHLLRSRSTPRLHTGRERTDR